MEEGKDVEVLLIWILGSISRRVFLINEVIIIEKQNSHVDVR